MQIYLVINTYKGYGILIFGVVHLPLFDYRRTSTHARLNDLDLELRVNFGEPQGILVNDFFIGIIHQIIIYFNFETICF